MVKVAVAEASRVKREVSLVAVHRSPAFLSRASLFILCPIHRRADAPLFVTEG